jgi:hypothetical protein
MKKNISWVKAGLTGLVVFLSLYISIIIKLQVDFKWSLMFAYALIGLLIAALSLLLSNLKIKYGPDILFALTIGAGIFLYTGMPKSSDGFSDLAVFVGWFMLIGVIVAAVLLYTVITLILRKRQENSK